MRVKGYWKVRHSGAPESSGAQAWPLRRRAWPRVGRGCLLQPSSDTLVAVARNLIDLILCPALLSLRYLRYCLALSHGAYSVAATYH